MASLYVWTLIVKVVAWEKNLAFVKWVLRNQISTTILICQLDRLKGIGCWNIFEPLNRFFCTLYVYVWGLLAIGDYWGLKCSRKWTWHDELVHLLFWPIAFPCTCVVEPWLKQDSTRTSQVQKNKIFHLAACFCGSIFSGKGNKNIAWFRQQGQWRTRRISNL